MGILSGLFGGGANAQPIPPAAMPPSLADPSIFIKAAAKRANAMSGTVATSMQGLVKPATTAPTSLVGG